MDRHGAPRALAMTMYIATGFIHGGSDVPVRNLYQNLMITTRTGIPRRGRDLLEGWRTEEFRHADPAAGGF